MSASPPPTAPSPELEGLGRALRQAREAKGLSLVALAEQLHMGQEQLQALEDGDPSRLPEKVFIVAQARRVASSLGLEADPLIQALRELEVPEEASTSRQLFQPSPAPGPRPSPGLVRGLILVLSLVAAAGALMLGWNLRGQRPLTPKTSPAATSEDFSPPAAPNQLSLSSAETSWLEVRTKSGKTLFKGSFKGNRQIPLDEPVQVLSGRPDLLIVQLGEAPPRPLGPIERVRWFTFKQP